MLALTINFCFSKRAPIVRTATCDPDLSEDSFIGCAMTMLTDTDLGELDMIRVHQGGNNIPWIVSRQGTFSFNSDNDDARRWSRLRAQHLKARENEERKEAAPDDVSAKFELIYSFTALDQVFLDLHLARGVTEDAFIVAALAELAPNELRQLVKISACQLGVGAQAAEPWILHRNGKFFFNPDVNPDADTRHWTDVKQRALENRAAQ